MPLILNENITKMSEAEIENKKYLPFLEIYILVWFDAKTGCLKSIQFNNIERNLIPTMTLKSVQN